PTSTIYGHENSSTSFEIGVFDSHHGESITALTVTGAPTGTVLYIHGSSTPITADGSGVWHLPTSSSFDSISVQPPNGYVGNMTLSINATAQNGSAAAVTTSQQVTVDVLDAAPTVSHAQQVFSAQVGSSITESVGAHAATGNSLSYALVSGESPAHGSVTFDQNGNFTYTANSGYTGSDQFQVLVTDNHGGATVQSETVLISDPFHSHQTGGFNHLGGSAGADGGIDGGGGDAHISQGDGNYAIYGNDGSATTGSGVCKTLLSLSALSRDEAYGAHMTYALGNVPTHCTVVDGNGNALDSAHLTDAQITAGVYLQFPDDHVAASFALSCTATLTESNGVSTVFAQTSLAVDTSFMGGNDTISAGNGNDVIYGGAGNNNITAGNGNDHITAYDGNNSLTLGSGNDTVTLGDGNNNLIVNGAGSNVYSLGGGTNTLTLNNLQSAQTVNLTGSGGHTVLAFNSAMANNLVDLSHGSGGNSVVVQNNGHAGGDTFLMDLKGGENITGGTGSNWTDIVDLSGHTAAGTPVTVAVGNQSWTEALNSHGTIDLTNNNTTHDVSGTVSFTDTSGHNLQIAFSNIEKINY
ncbi:MAG TPA: cadherin-like domain-containing protein, partial [Rhodospirillaceae bacterium]|nr:cadherin-like domain-containing protein [Rhodospirillaceae bacterium]